MVKESRIFFFSGEGGRIVKKKGVTKNEAGDFNFKFRPINAVNVKEVNGIPAFLVMHVDRSLTPNAPPEGCYIVFTDTFGSKVKTQEFIDIFIKQLETANARASLAEGQSTRLSTELKKFKEQTRQAVEQDADFHEGLKKKGRTRRDYLGDILPRKVRTVGSPDEYDEDMEMEE